MSFQEYAESLKSFRSVKSLDDRTKIGIAIVAAVILAIVLFGMAKVLLVSEASEEAVDEAVLVPSAPSEEEVIAESCLYVTGCVVRPGIVYVDSRARLADAIDAAGGLTEEADAASINLAREVIDGEQVHVPRVGESDSRGTVAQGGSTGPSNATAQSGKVSLNSATLSDLMTLSGIGESKASKIIEYRNEHGPFKSVDELTNISGIGAKTVDALRDSICL